MLQKWLSSTNKKQNVFRWALQHIYYSVIPSLTNLFISFHLSRECLEKTFCESLQFADVSAMSQDLS